MLSPEPVQSALPAVTQLTLLAAFGEMFGLALDVASWPEGRPVLVEQYPLLREGSFDHSFDVILYHLVHSETASTSNDGSRKPKGWWGYSRRPHPTKARYALVHSWWQESVVVDFTVLAKSASRANQLADWYHRTVLLYAHGMKFFQARGVNELRFLERLEDRTTKDYGQELFARPLRYSLRLELSDITEVKLLEEVSIAVNGEKVA